MGLFDFLQEEKAKAQPSGKAGLTPAPEATPQEKKIRKPRKLTAGEAESFMAEARGRWQTVIGSGPSDTNQEVISKVRQYFLQNYGDKPEARAVHPLYQDFLKMMEAQETLDEAARTAKPAEVKPVTTADAGRAQEELKRAYEERQALEHKGVKAPIELTQKIGFLEAQHQRMTGESKIAPKPPAPGFTTNLMDAFKGAQVKLPHVVDAVREITEKYNINSKERVAFATGVQRMIGDEFPDLADDFLSSYETRPKPQGKPRPEGEERPEVDPEDREIYMHREKMKKLGEAQELQTWIGVIVFTLLSAIVGAKSAVSMFFAAMQNGTLARQIKELEREIAAAQRRKAERGQREWEIRKMAAQDAFIRRRQAEARDFDLEKMYENNRLLVARLDKSGKADDETIKSLLGDFNRAVANRQDAKAMMERFGARPDEVEYEKARYKKYNDEAAAIHELLRKRTLALLGAEEKP